MLEKLSTYIQKVCPLLLDVGEASLEEEGDGLGLLLGSEKGSEALSTFSEEGSSCLQISFNREDGSFSIAPGAERPGERVSAVVFTKYSTKALSEDVGMSRQMRVLSLGGESSVRQDSSGDDGDEEDEGKSSRCRSTLETLQLHPECFHL